MHISEIGFYCCPSDHSELRLERAEIRGDEVVTGQLVSAAHKRYPIQRGVPYLVYPQELSPIEAQTQSDYDRVAEKVYDIGLEWQFAALYEDENRNRELMVDMLAPQPHHRVLEVGCGTGRDSFRIARRLGREGSLFLQDLSSSMVYTCIGKMDGYGRSTKLECSLHYSVSNATWLPFPDGFFDSVFHFGGFNQFGDMRRAAQEFARITKPGGRVLFGDESVGPWLKGSEFDQIVCTNNPLFRAELPISVLPECARDVQLRWIMGNCFYVIVFTKGDGPPPLNLDLPHEGWRGGTMRSRYYGRLEGVSPEVKSLVIKAAAKCGLSVHEWLDRSLRRDSEHVLSADGQES